MADREGGTRAVRYEPGRDAADRYPDWVIRHRALSHGIPEVMCRRRKVILIESAETWPAKRCSLAHAVAHLDLGHTTTPAGVFERDQEIDANQLAARRLITVEDLAAVLCWTRYDTEIAEELEVDLETLRTRKRHLHPSERAELQRQVLWLEETA
jgi:Zn-dependent peptidase ImmA (M78 family)